MEEKGRVQLVTHQLSWKIHFKSEPAVVYDFLVVPEKRKRYWAESAEEADGVIHYVFLNGIEDHGRILEKIPTQFFRVEYFGMDVSFDLQACDGGGCDMNMTCNNVDDDDRYELNAGWVSWLMAMKAAVDFGVDLRNHDTDRTWFNGFADN